MKRKAEKISDRERLDYMARNGFYPFWLQEGRWGNSWDIFKAQYPGPRQAIDAAIRASRRRSK